MLHVTSNNLDKNKATLKNVSLELLPLEQKIFQFIREAINEMPKNPTARVVGGWVRDKLLGVPSYDIDITVDTMSGKEFANALVNFGLRRYGSDTPVKIFNVEFDAKDDQVKAIAAGQVSIFGQHIDLVSLRKELWTSPITGEKLVRNPIVVNGTPEDDSMRRDLTINSLFYRINDGVVEDFAGGYEDLATMTLRTPTTPEGMPNGKPPGMDQMEWQYKESLRIFTEDPVRLLRILRFYSKYPTSKIFGYDPKNNQDGPVVRAMHNNTVKSLLTEKLRNPAAKGIVAERNADEFRKIMLGNRPEAALQIMWKTGLLSSLLNLPQDFAPLDMTQNNKWHDQNVIEHILMVVKNVNQIGKKFNLPDQDRLMLNLGGLFHDLGKLDPRAQKVKRDGTMGFYGNPTHPEAKTHQKSSSEIWMNFVQTMKLSNKERDVVGDVISQHMTPHDHIETMSPSVIGKFKDTNPNWKLIYLHAMGDAMSKGQVEDPEASSPYEKMMQTMDQMQIPALLSGNEIIQITGLKPGPIIGEILKAVRQQQYKNLATETPLSVPQQKEQAKQIALSFVPVPLTKQEISDIISARVKQSPVGQQIDVGNIKSVVRQQLNQARNANPKLSKNEATAIVNQTIDSFIV